MSYLFLAILCSSSIALIFKYSESRGLNRYAVTSVNYLAACLTSGLLIWNRGGLVSTKPALGSSLEGIIETLMAGKPIEDPSSGLVWAVICGLAAGAIFFLAFVFYQKSVKEEGVGLSGAFAKLGILVPMALSLALWREYPTGLQWLGMAIAVFSIFLVNWPTRRNRWQGLRTSLILLFVFAGLAEFSNKVFQKYGIVDLKDAFLLTTFFVALLLSLMVTVRRRQVVTGKDWLTGLAVGIPNYFSSYFLILALEGIPAAVAFPVFGAGTILTINVGGALIFRERLRPKDIAVIVLVGLSLILVSA